MFSHLVGKALISRYVDFESIGVFDEFRVSDLEEQEGTRLTCPINILASLHGYGARRFAERNPWCQGTCSSIGSEELGPLESIKVFVKNKLLGEVYPNKAGLLNGHLHGDVDFKSGIFADSVGILKVECYEAESGRVGDPR